MKRLLVDAELQILNRDLYPNKTGIHSILLYLLAEKAPGIPYYCTDILLMVPTDEYRSIVKKREPSIQKAAGRYEIPVVNESI